MTGKHHAPGRFVASGGESCPRCGSAVVGQFCEACGFRVSARRPFAPLGHQAERYSAAPAEAREMLKLRAARVLFPLFSRTAAEARRIL